MAATAYDRSVACPNCGHSVPFTPKTTYRCINCDILFYTLKDDTQAYLCKAAGYRFRFAHLFLVICLIAMTIWELDMLDWFGGPFAKYWPVVPWVMAISLILALFCISGKDT